MRLRTWLDGVLNRLSTWWQPARRRFRKGYLPAPAPQHLEHRLLLTIDNLASISGVVYDDLTDNGLTGDDVRQQNVQVELFQDGGNGTFDSDDFLAALQRGSYTTSMKAVPESSGPIWLMLSLGTALHFCKRNSNRTMRSPLDSPASR